MKKAIHTLAVLLLLSLLTSCVTDTEQSVDKVHKILGNGVHLEVEKTNVTRHHKNILTNRSLGDGHSFSYKFNIEKGDINWDGGTGEPKHLLFCKDSVYVHYLKEKHETANAHDTLSATRSGVYKIRELYEVFIDERSFFNMFGEAYWVAVSPEVYALKKATCTEYEVPNDNELTIIPVPVPAPDTLKKPAVQKIRKTTSKSKRSKR